jgi:hypothetical protein
MSVNDPDHEATGPDVPEQPADPFEPEAPAHLEPDGETIVHDEDLDQEDLVDEPAPAPDQPSS